MLWVGIGLALTGSGDWDGPDKALHFGASAGIGAGAYFAGALVEPAPWRRLPLAFTASLAVGLAKEVHDATAGRSFSGPDLVFDALGAATGVLIAWFLEEAFPVALGSIRTKPSRPPRPASPSHGKRWRPGLSPAKSQLRPALVH